MTVALSILMGIELFLSMTTQEMDDWWVFVVWTIFFIVLILVDILTSCAVWALNHVCLVVAIVMQILMIIPLILLSLLILIVALTEQDETGNYIALRQAGVFIVVFLPNAVLRIWITFWLRRICGILKELTWDRPPAMRIPSINR